MTQSILVVDDDRSILELVCELLTDVGYDVRGTVDSVEGLRWVQEATPDLIVLDMRMPVIDGWRFKQELVVRGVDVPIVVMTAAQNARQWASEIDAIGYVAKPFDIDRLLEVVELSLPPKPSEDNVNFCRLEAAFRARLDDVRHDRTAQALVESLLRLTRMAPVRA